MINIEKNIKMKKKVLIFDIDGVLLDIGVSSMQLDKSLRGFSFRNDGPLDMRMSRNGPTASDFINNAEENLIAEVINKYGEEEGMYAGLKDGQMLTTNVDYNDP